MLGIRVCVSSLNGWRMRDSIAAVCSPHPFRQSLKAPRWPFAALACIASSVASQAVLDGSFAEGSAATLRIASKRALVAGKKCFA
jgi:hypothetical protein